MPYIIRAKPEEFWEKTNRQKSLGAVVVIIEVEFLMKM